MADTMRTWSLVQTTDPDDTKKVNQRGGFTAICPVSQVKKATQLWGEMGGKWGYRDASYELVAAEEEVIVVCLLTLFCPHGEIPSCPGTAKLVSCTSRGKHVDAEAWKKARTDALTKGLSWWGFNADVFLGMFDDSRYVETLRAAKGAECASNLVELERTALSKVGGEAIAEWARSTIDRGLTPTEWAMKRAVAKLGTMPSKHEEAGGS